MTDKTFNYGLLFIFIILLGSIIFFVPENDKGTAISAITALIAAGSLILSKKSFEQTERTLKLAENEQQTRENEQQIREIEEGLKLFYYPLEKYFSLQNRTLKKPPTDDDIRGRVSAEVYRHLATDTTKNLIEECIKEKYTNGEHKDDLKIAIRKDIEDKKTQIGKLKTRKTE